MCMSYSLCAVWYWAGSVHQVFQGLVAETQKPAIAGSNTDENRLGETKQNNKVAILKPKRNELKLLIANSLWVCHNKRLFYVTVI